MSDVRLFFDERKLFELKNIKTLSGIAGLYFIFLDSLKIRYPYKESKLIYIGMSEKVTNSIANRLTGHYDGKSKNIGIQSYKQVDKVWFTYLNIEMLKQIWTFRVEDLESYFIFDFVKNYGVYPICNNKSGFEIKNLKLETNIKIEWEYFNN
jgi:hypothetical protein